MRKKRVKLAVIRDNENNPCPFSLPVDTACKSVGEHILRMAPLEVLGPEATPEEKKKISDANMKVFTWSIMHGDTKPQPCTFAANLIKDKVDCSYGDTAAGTKQKGSLIGSPFYSSHFSGIGLEGLYTYPIGFYGDMDIGRNLFYSVYSLQGSSNKTELVKLARYILEMRKRDLSANKIE